MDKKHGTIIGLLAVIAVIFVSGCISEENSSTDISDNDYKVSDDTNHENEQNEASESNNPSKPEQDPEPNEEPEPPAEEG